MSSIDYLLLLKKNIQQQISFCEDQKEFIQDLDSFHFNTDEECDATKNILYSNDKLSDLFLDLKNCFLMDETLQKLTSLKKEIESFLQIKCKHNITKDLVDIHPDESREIHYCSICESTFEIACKYSS